MLCLQTQTHKFKPVSLNSCSGTAMLPARGMSKLFFFYTHKKVCVASQNLFITVVPVGLLLSLRAQHCTGVSTLA